ncbi:unnamed protein product [Hymenolepis diminuta]|uniref:Uncharacterized protein n=1 Tax=Hymenolepis diminuta TaxID=6216 RepID=A0A564YDD5_HYMDI|nr:unnamed protein product [Hymenolepis diminuta]
MPEEIYTPSPQISQINPASLREFLPEHAPGVFMVLESHFKHNNTRSQINKFHVIIGTIPPSLIVQFANIIQKPSQILMMTSKLLSYDISNHLQPSGIKLLAPGESLDTDFWKLLYFKKLSSYIQPILANALKTEPIESLAEMAENIMETAGPPRIEEILHTSHLKTRSEPAATWEKRMLKLEAKIDAHSTEEPTTQPPIQ